MTGTRQPPGLQPDSFQDSKSPVVKPSLMKHPQQMSWEWMTAVLLLHLLMVCQMKTKC